jgi:hypothetical protein
MNRWQHSFLQWVIVHIGFENDGMSAALHDTE